ncbi:hypothetical protein [Corynebacterium vitaeruminis]|uniref:hypothetical protein n=1 Tax=Corynebacterium vitaeruminis TaxID=38305 RepID=UPI0012DCBF36|nr:hypothetical protein [Corynebacterium vitaeruminis]
MNETEQELAFKVYQERLWDNLSVRKPGDPPTNLPALLNDLGVKGKPAVEQRAAVEEWLKDNEPIGLLRLQIRRLDGLLG